MKDRIGYIYKITAPDGKIYIGQTINIKQRRSCYKRNRHIGQIKLWNSCQAHDWNPIDTFEIIEECLCGENKSIINKREIYWVAFYDSYNTGLNCTAGGDGNLGVKWTEERKIKFIQSTTGKKRSAESKKIMSDAQKGKQLSKVTKEKIKQNHNRTYESISEETRKKMSDSKKGNIPWNKGIPRSEETKEKIRQTLKNKNGQ